MPLLDRGPLLMDDKATLPGSALASSGVNRGVKLAGPDLSLCFICPSLSSRGSPCQHIPSRSVTQNCMHVHACAAGIVADPTFEDKKHK